jgi:hypothetical protein
MTAPFPKPVAFRTLLGIAHQRIRPYLRRELVADRTRHGDTGCMRNEIGGFTDVDEVVRTPVYST